MLKVGYRGIKETIGLIEKRNGDSDELQRIEKLQAFSSRVELIEDLKRTNVVSLSRTRVDSDANTSLEAEGEGCGTVGQLDSVFLVTLEGVDQKVLGLMCHELSKDVRGVLYQTKGAFGSETEVLTSENRSSAAMTFKAAFQPN